MVAAALFLGATACQEAEPVQISANESFTFSASLSQTRTCLGEGNKLMWNEGDNIRIFTPQNTDGVVFMGDATAPSATANFSAAEFASSEDGYFAIYPENLTNIGTWPYSEKSPEATFDNGVWSVRVNLPTRYYSNNAGWDDRFNYIVAYSSDQTLKFQAATAYIKVVYRGKNGATLEVSAGAASLTHTAMLNYDTKSGEISYTPINTAGFAFIYDVQDGQTYYIPVYPTTISSLTIFSNDKNTSDVELLYLYPDTIKFEAGKIYTVELSNEAAAAEHSYTLKSADGAVDVPMVLDDKGLFVAKGVAHFTEAYIEVSDGANVTKLATNQSVIASKWLETTTADNLYFPSTEGGNFDVYYSAQTNEMCVVIANAMAPLLPSEEAELQLLGTGQMCEGIVSSMFGITSHIIDVEMYTHPQYEGYLFLKNAYTKNYPFTGTNDCREDDVYMVIDISNPEHVIIPMQHTGCYADRFQYGEIIISSLMPGTLVDGLITFPVNGLASGVTIYTNGEMGFYGNHSGAFYVRLPGSQQPEESELFFSASLYYVSEIAPGMQSEYPDSTSLAIVMKGKDVVEVSYNMLVGNSGASTPLEGSDAEVYIQSLCEGSGLAEEQILYKLPAGQLINTINNSGLIAYSSGLTPSTYYTLIVKAVNSKGDANYVVHTMATKSEDEVAQTSSLSLKRTLMQPTLKMVNLKTKPTLLQINQ